MSLSYRLIEIEHRIPFEAVLASWAERREMWVHKVIMDRHNVQLLGELTRELLGVLTADDTSPAGARTSRAGTGTGTGGRQRVQ